MSDRATAISLRACSTRAAAARRSWFAPIASSTSFLSAGSLKTVHHGKSASDAGSGGPCWPLVTSGVATVGRLYSGPSAQAANSGSAAKIARSPVALLLTAGSPAQQHVEYRRQEQAEQRDAEHAAEDRGPQGLAHLGPGAGGERQRPALILGGVDEKDEEHAKRKDEDRGVARELRLIGEVRPFDLHPGREHPGGKTLHRRRGRAQAAARRRVAVHLGSREHVVAY